MADKAPNVTHLKDLINSGRSGDKVAGFDPAAAPLGADAEAGGAPPTPPEIAQAIAHERRGRPANPDANASAPERAPAGDRSAGGLITGNLALAMAAAFAAFVALFFALYWLA